MSMSVHQRPISTRQSYCSVLKPGGLPAWHCVRPPVTAPLHLPGLSTPLRGARIQHMPETAGGFWQPPDSTALQSTVLTSDKLIAI
jgi:hypothetical protein